ncbi:hypothetical protein RI543_004757 [Arxiozyma heterogenica]|uniref:Karyogamy protein n=1 Tax=Arxiozyma heterogenica TaxID=278026 RepID=A0AAN7ZRG6_9SACH|nr:hypothetical protein RI543_004757 [Kazachstania heterogenica]
MDVQSARNDLQPCFNRLKNLLNTLDGYTKYDYALEQQLQSLKDDLELLNEILTKLFLDCKQGIATGNLSIPFNNSILQQNLVIIHLIDDSDKYDITFSHLLDIMELNEYENHFDIIIDLIESCNFAKNKLQSLLTNLKIYIDIILEYHEILNDNMKTLDIIINKNIDNLFSLQDIKNTSPMRHVPSFTLNQLIKILSKDYPTTIPLSTNSKDNTNAQLKLPKFSPMEEKLIKNFMKIQSDLKPIETSLLEVLPQRLQQFEKRHQYSNKGIDILTLNQQLKRSYKELFQNFKFLNSKVNSLKKDLIDKRWNIIFTNLNHELEFLINEMERNYQLLVRFHNNTDVTSDNTQSNSLNETNLNTDGGIESSLLSTSASYKISKQLTLQMEKVTTTVSKTFDVIYAAAEFSLLDEKIANKTNELARNWVNLRPQSDQLILIVKNKLKSQQHIITETKTKVPKNCDSSFLDIETLEPPPPLLSTASKSRRSSNNSYLSHGSDSESDVGNRTIETIVNDLRKFSIATTTNLHNNNNANKENEDIFTKRSQMDANILKKPILKSGSLQNDDTKITTLKSGAKLLEKMHIKPIIVSTSIAESASKDIDNENNPFFDSQSLELTKFQSEHQSNTSKKTQRKKKTRSLILSTLPPLIHKTNEKDITKDQFPPLLKESMNRTVSSSLTILASPLSLKNTSINDEMSTSYINSTINNNESDFMDSTTVEIVESNDIGHHSEILSNNLTKSQITANTPIRYDICDQVLSQTAASTDVNNGTKSINPKVHSFFTSSSSTSSISKNDMLDFCNNSSEIATPKRVTLPQQEELITHISPETFNQLLCGRIEINQKKPSLIPHIQNNNTYFSNERIKPISLPRKGHKVFLSKRIPTPTPLSQLLTQSSQKILG